MKKGKRRGLSLTKAKNIGTTTLSTQNRHTTVECNVQNVDQKIDQKVDQDVDKDVNQDVDQVVNKVVDLVADQDVDKDILDYVQIDDDRHDDENENKHDEDSFGNVRNEFKSFVYKGLQEEQSDSGLQQIDSGLQQIDSDFQREQMDSREEKYDILEDDLWIATQKVSDGVIPMDPRPQQQNSYHDPCSCPTCGKDLTMYNEFRRSTHANLCLDQALAFQEFQEKKKTLPSQEKKQTLSSLETTTLYSCTICDAQVHCPSLESRITHIRKCGKKYGIRPQDFFTSSDYPENNKNGNKVEMESNAQFQEKKSEWHTLDLGQEEKNNQPVNAFQLLMKSARIEKKAESMLSNFVSHPSSTLKKKKRFSSSGTNRNMGTTCCPWFKKIPGTQPPFVVDGFQYASKQLSTIYFLTHFHSDHYGGLTKDFSCGIIYCNAVTANLVQLHLGVNRELIKELPMNIPYKLNDIQVTLIDANHCPGAALLLFQLPNGKNILHTGDFRYDESLSHHPALSPFVTGSLTNDNIHTNINDTTPASTTTTTSTTTPNSSNASSTKNKSRVGSYEKLDIVYLDTTYCNPKYTFPSQNEVIQRVLALMKNYLQSPRTLFLFGSYTIGKERLFMEVAKQFHLQVYVDRWKRRTISCLNWSEQMLSCLTCNQSNANLRVVPMGHLNFDKMKILLSESKESFNKIVAFRPTGWSYTPKNGSMISCRKNGNESLIIHDVPYSEHSSFKELCQFIKTFRPHQIIPTVNCGTKKKAQDQVDLLHNACYKTIFG